VAGRWSAGAGDPGYDPRADLDGDDRIGVLDILIAASRWQ